MALAFESQRHKNPGKPSPQRRARSVRRRQVGKPAPNATDPSDSATAREALRRLDCSPEHPVSFPPFRGRPSPMALWYDGGLQAVECLGEHGCMVWITGI
jgi:hypothetical protein